MSTDSRIPPFDICATHEDTVNHRDMQKDIDGHEGESSEGVRRGGVFQDLIG